MADIELVIKVDEDDYKDIKEYGFNGYSDQRNRIVEAIANGTPLPQGHGDLKDMGNLKYVFDLTKDNPIYSGKDIERAIKSMTTVIDADNESED